MTGRACIGVVMTQVKSIKKCSELLDKQVNAQKETLIKNFQGSHRLPQAYGKMCNENEKRKNDGCLKYF